jgi:Vitamin B12 dependent methionine synthase, activation domain
MTVPLFGVLFKGAADGRGAARRRVWKARAIFDMLAASMEAIHSIPFRLEPSDLRSRLRLDPSRPGFPSPDALIRIAGERIHPRAVYEAAFIGAKGERTVDVAGVRFTSPVLRRNLDGANRVFPYIITIGPELERAAAAQGDLLVQYYLEEMANTVLEQAAAWLAAELAGRHGLGPLSNLSPGSLEDWPITEQIKLFAIFGDTERLIGVRLTDSLLMVPRKSISGILFPSEEGFTACQLCDRARCSGRKAPYGGAKPVTKETS